MYNSEIKDLCINLAKAKNEKEVILILKKAKLWDDDKVWEDYGQNPNNFSTIGNQQSNPDTALVEKIINSVDAVLTKNCWREGINPTSPAAPKSIPDALEKYYKIQNGKLSSIDASVRTEIAKNIFLIATGEKSNPCYSIIDFGEGQTPKKIPETFLSLNKSNKINIQFVQGKFNMGGTGALQFCSKEKNLQLIISRRDPQIVALNKNSKSYEEDDTENMWGFTIVKRENPNKDMRSSSFKYLAPNGKILMFNAENIPLLPLEYPKAYGGNFNYGTFIKLYEYQIGGLKTNVKFDLYYRLSLLLTNIALPITMYERRDGYEGASHHIVMSGLSVRLDDDKSDNLEENFPSSENITVTGQKMKVLVYAFKKDKREKYSRKEGIIFTINGQAHGNLPQTFFDRSPVGLSYLADSILLIVDCSEFDRRIQEDLFMNSRDRLRTGNALEKEIERKLEALLKEHKGLRDLSNQRRQEELKNKLQDSKPLTEILQNIIKKNPTLSKIFLEGGKISNPFDTTTVGTKNIKFNGNKFPTYFKLAENFSKEKPKSAAINRDFRIKFETDVENEYFGRDQEQGKFSISLNGDAINDFGINLWNGLATLTVSLPENIKVDDLLLYHTETTDVTKSLPFCNDFYVKILPPDLSDKGKGGIRINPPGGNDPTNNPRQISSKLQLPPVFELRKKDANWSKYFDNMNEEGAMAVQNKGENDYDFFVNMDNIFLLMEIKEKFKEEPKILEARFEYGMVLIGLALIRYFENKKNKKNSDNDNGMENENNVSLCEQISITCRAISPMLLPIISLLDELDIDKNEHSLE